MSARIPWILVTKIDDYSLTILILLIMYFLTLIERWTESIVNFGRGIVFPTLPWKRETIFF